MASLADKILKSLSKQPTPARNDRCSLCKLPPNKAKELEAALVAKRDNPSVSWHQIIKVLEDEFGIKIGRDTLSTHYNYHWSKRNG